MNIETIQLAIKNNLPLLIFGKSGWGKTALVEAAGTALGMETVTLSLALCLPEDVGGIPRPDSEGKSFHYLLPKWFHERQGKDFVLFLDEINQAPPQVLHAIYGLVQKRELHGVRNPGMRVVAAGNFAEENPHLTEIMQPLLNRFYVVDFIHDPQPALAYLNNKYPGLALKDLETSPRDTEQGILAFKAGLKDLAIKKAGLRIVQMMERSALPNPSGADELIQAIKGKEIQDRNGFI